MRRLRLQVSRNDRIQQKGHGIVKGTVFELKAVFVRVSRGRGPHPTRDVGGARANRLGGGRRGGSKGRNGSRDSRLRWSLLVTSRTFVRHGEKEERMKNRSKATEDV
jgi:hypothetical protein